MTLPITGPDGRTGPLRGVRVLDHTTIIMGPYSTQILGDLGAEVIKVEEPAGDLLRWFVPARSEGMSGVSFNLHRNKRSVVLDLKSDAGREAFLAIAATCDLLVTNVRGAAIDRLGIGYEAVRSVRPDIVYCHAVGFGSDGPYAGKAAYDDVAQAASGLSDLIMRQTGKPSFSPTAVGDKVSALTIVYSAIAGLFHRDRTGEGQHIEIPMTETITAFNLVEHIEASVFDPPLGPVGYPRLLTPHRRPYQTADGWACLLPYTNQNWLDFFDIAGSPEMASDERYSTQTARVKNIDALYTWLSDVARTKTTAEWMEQCDRHSIPAVPMLDLDRVGDDPHLGAVGMLSKAEHPTDGSYWLIDSPVRFGASPAGLARHAPRLGEHTEEVLREVGLDDDALARVLARAHRE